MQFTFNSGCDGRPPTLEKHELPDQDAAIQLSETMIRRMAGEADQSAFVAVYLGDLPDGEFVGGWDWAEGEDPFWSPHR